MIALLGDDAVYCQRTTRADQYFHSCGIFYEDNPQLLAYSVAGQLFGVDKRTVTKQAKKFLDHLINSDRDLGRRWPPILNPSQLIDLKTCIITAYTERRPSTMSQIQCYLNEDLYINVSTTTLAHLLAWDPNVRSCAGIRMDESRMDILIEAIREHFAFL
jgi:hypothetical protein